MVEKNFKAKCITIRKEQHDFVENQRQTFNLSKFVQAKLDEYKLSLEKNREEL